jgi:hypothetical protein
MIKVSLILFVGTGHRVSWLEQLKELCEAIRLNQKKIAELTAKLGRPLDNTPGCHPVSKVLTRCAP